MEERALDLIGVHVSQAIQEAGVRNVSYYIFEGKHEVT